MARAQEQDLFRVWDSLTFTDEDTETFEQGFNASDVMDEHATKTMM